MWTPRKNWQSRAACPCRRTRLWWFRGTGHRLQCRSASVSAHLACRCNGIVLPWPLIPVTQTSESALGLSSPWAERCREPRFRRHSQSVPAQNQLDRRRPEPTRRRFGSGPEHYELRRRVRAFSSPRRRSAETYTEGHTASNWRKSKGLENVKSLAPCIKNRLQC